MSNVLRNLPTVNELLDSPPLKSLVRQINRGVVSSGVRSFLEKLRTDAQNASGISIPAPSELAERIAQWIAGEQAGQRPVINATGIVLHPQLGGAPLADEAIQAIAAVAASYAPSDPSASDREAILDRFAVIQRLLNQLTGAESAMVVNNGSAATVLALSEVAAGREVLVSRGQLLDTGDGYRVAEAIASSGAVLREVGATNRTTIDDFAQAVTDRTAAMMRVHAGNFAIVGAAEQPPLSELAALARRHNLTFIDDVGSGALLDFNRYGIVGEPVVADSVKAGADLVLFSGDKLLGGPQSGLIVGRRQWVERLARHPLARSVATDKLTLAALAATLGLYGDLALAERSLPLLTMLSTPVDNLKNRAERLAVQIQASAAVAGANAIEEETYLAGLNLPGHRLATWCIAVTPAEGTVNQLAARLCAGAPSVVVRLHRGRLLIDLRSVRPRHDQELAAAFQLLAPTPEVSPTADDKLEVI